MDTADKTAEQTESVASLKDKRAMARSVIATFAATSAAVTTLPLPYKDAAMLSPIELAEINALADVYGIPKDQNVLRLFETTIGLGLASSAARQALRLLDRRPRIKLSSRAESAIIASGLVAFIGITTAIAFERVNMGQLSMEDIDLSSRFQRPAAVEKASQRLSSMLGRVFSEETVDGLKASLSEMRNTIVGM